MDIQKMYGVSDAQLQLQNIGREREERETARARTMQYGAQSLVSGIKGYKSEQQLQAKELKSHLAGDKAVYQTSVKHTDKAWYDPSKFFAKGKDMVEYTPEFTGKLDTIKELEGLQQAQTITAPDMETLTKLKGQVAPFLKDPAVGMGSKLKDLLKGSQMGGVVSGVAGGVEMAGKGFHRESDAYKAATTAQTVTGLLALVPGMQGMSLVSGGLGLGKGLFR